MGPNDFYSNEGSDDGEVVGVEWSLPTPKVLGSNPVIDNFFLLFLSKRQKYGRRDPSSNPVIDKFY